jgi:hypothetical protein
MSEHNEVMTLDRLLKELVDGAMATLGDVSEDVAIYFTPDLDSGPIYEIAGPAELAPGDRSLIFTIREVGNEA